MHIEVLAEDKSGSRVLDGLMEKFTRETKSRHTWAVRPHRGKGYFPQDPKLAPRRLASGLLDLLPAKLRAYQKVFAADELLIVIVLDADDEDPAKLRRDLEQMRLRFAGSWPVIVGISIEEMEAWLLGDHKAIQQAYPKADLTQAQNYRQDSVCGTWQVLAHVILKEDAKRLIEVGYPAVGQYKSQWAEKIVRYMQPDRNRSPSFQDFRAGLTDALLEAKTHGKS